MMHFIWEIIQETWVIILVFAIFIFFTTKFDTLSRKNIDEDND